MTPIPAPSAWRYEHKNKSGGTLYIYSTRLEPADGPDYVQMYTSGQLNQYGQACFEEGASSVHTPDRSDKAVMQQALDALLGYKPNSLTHAKEQGSAIIALRAAIAQPVQPAVALIEECRAALAEELAGLDIDPPLQHVKQAHDRCVEWLARAAIAQPVQPAAQDAKDAERLHWLCSDMRNGPEKRARDALLTRMCVMTYSAICAGIDAELLAAGSKQL